MKRLFMYLSVCLFSLSCKKDPTEIIKEITPPTEKVSWNDTQKVRILKVEQTASPNSFPFDIDALMTVDYIYSKGVLTGIAVRRGETTYTFPNTSAIAGKYEFDLTDDPVLAGGIFQFRKISLLVASSKLSSGHNSYKFDFPWAEGPALNKNAKYSYSSNGTLASITGSEFITGMRENELHAGTYKNGLLKNYTVKNYIPDYQVIPNIGQELEIQATYQTASGVPDGLIRYINQAVLGLSQIGFEDYYYQMQYDLRPGSALATDGGHTAAVAKYNHTFADWIISFGLNEAFTIPHQGNQLIFTKHTTGKKVIDGTPESVDGSTPLVYEYSNVDVSSSYPYIHKADEKIIEIAGLRIYYDWADDEYSTPQDTLSLPAYATITDPRDGQQYKIVTIGTQTWFAENLRYAGDIPNITDYDEWREIYLSNNTTTAWCHYDNNTSNDAVYGKLYNWNAVNTGSICPDGWHIPTDGEWTILSNYLGGEKIAGGKMKSTTSDWAAPNTGATNESGFTGLPGGIRRVSPFVTQGVSGIWWSSTRENNNAYWRVLNNNNTEFNRYFNNIYYGASCRCLKDK